MKKFLLLSGILLLGLGLSSIPAQTPAATPDENPEGNTGALKAQITTGGSYDAHSGNATRTVNDLHVPGALGVYGLDFTRHWNSIPNDYYNAFAELPSSFGASGWSHSWEWHANEEDTLDDLHGDGSETVYTTAITITFPDGHANRYKITRSNVWHFGETGPPDPRCGPPYTTPEQNAFTGAPYDLLKDMAPDGSQFWLYQADGGSVHFMGGPGYYQAREIFDPHGLRTQLDYDGNGHLTTVTQEGSRWLTITWGSHEGLAALVIDRVDTGGYAGTQSVVYHYSRYPDTNGSFLTLTSVIYPEGASAAYTYGDYVGEDENSAHSTYPLLKTADDPRYAGAMTHIFYTYNGGSCPVAPAPSCYCLHRYFQCVPTSIAAEKSADQFDQFGQHITVSSFNINCFSGTRTETSGLGGSRTFYFGDSAGGPGTYSILGYQLAKLTDFVYANPPPTGLPFEWQNYKDGQPRQIWDGRNIETEAIVTPGDLSGQPGEIHHVTADGSYQIFNRVNPGASDAQDFSKVPNRFNHWLFSHRDESGLTTTYVRDSRRRVKDINYDNGSSEHFTYNEFNQVETHTLPSDTPQTPVVQYYHYNPLHQLDWEYNTVDGWDARKAYTYDSLENIAAVSDGRSRSASKDFSTRMTYNGRHQILTVEYAGMNNAPDNPKVQYGYDSYGNCEWISDELATTPQDPNHTKRYTYDSYRRCISYTEPLNAPDWQGNPGVASRTWNWDYDRDIEGVGLRGSYTQTSKEWRLQKEPVFNAAGQRRMTARIHDVNNRLKVEMTGLIMTSSITWDYGSDGETHSFTYDENGQKSSYTDPLGRQTTYEYDLRNRLWKTHETVNTIPRTTETLYDVTGNKTDVTFPDTRSEHWLDYDAFGQPGRFIDERNNTTHLTYRWGPMKKLDTVTTHRDKDSGGTEDQCTTFNYDGMGRLTWTFFPDAVSSEHTTYLFGQVDTFKTRKNQTKHIHYDARGREDYSTWEGDAAPRIDRVWDSASRLVQISNLFSTIEYAYDDASQPKYERSTVAGSGGAAQINYYRYGNGDVAHYNFPYGFMMRKDYSARGQLNTVGWDDGAGNWQHQLINYYYRADGKVDHQIYGNGTRSDFGYDGRGFTNSTHHYRMSPSQNYSYRDYARDERDRMRWFSKGTDASVNPMENGLGDFFWYDAEGQLTDSVHNAANYGGNPGGGNRWEHFNYDALGNRYGSNIVGLYGWQNFYRRDNGLNQYTSWAWFGVSYDSAPSNGVLMADGWIGASYNALNQPTGIWSPAFSGTGGQMWFGYDPLGRCVKRSVGPSGDANSNPATYLYYDGWNLIQEGPSAGSPSRLYAHGNRIDEIAATFNAGTGQFGYHHYDARGDCTLLTDSSGGIIEQYEYDAFGLPYFFDSTAQPLNSSTFGNRFLFTGREWLSELNLYDYRNRLYQPQLGRFLQPDPKEFAAGDYNLYRYCHNDPVNKSDPSGLIDEGHMEPDALEGAIQGSQKLLSSIGHDIAQAYREQGPVMFVVNAGMMLSRGQKIEGMRLPGFRPPLGTRVRPEGLPTNWRISPTEGEGGTHYYNPQKPNESVRVMPGNPNSPFPNSQKPYVRQTDSSGSYLDANGNRGNPNSPETHIPLEEFHFRPSK
jgi:RHS repeat-associated protein